MGKLAMWSGIAGAADAVQTQITSNLDAQRAERLRRIGEDAAMDRAELAATTSRDNTEDNNTARTADTEAVIAGRSADVGAQIQGNLDAVKARTTSAEKISGGRDATSITVAGMGVDENAARTRAAGSAAARDDVNARFKPSTLSAGTQVGTGSRAFTVETETAALQDTRSGLWYLQESSGDLGAHYRLPGTEPTEATSYPSSREARKNLEAALAANPDQYQLFLRDVGYLPINFFDSLTTRQLAAIDGAYAQPPPGE